MKKIIAISICSVIISYSALHATCPSVDEVREQVLAFQAKNKDKSDDGKYRVEWVKGEKQEIDEKAAGQLTFGPLKDGSCHYAFEIANNGGLGIVYNSR